MVSTGRELLENMEKYRDMQMRYWYGGKGQIATKALADTLRKENPGVWTDSYYSEALEDVNGKTVVCDCSGLVCLVYRIPHIGSYQIAERFQEWEGEPKRGMIAWKPGHVGLIYSKLGGYMAEMRSIKYDYKENRTYKSAGMQKILYSPEIDYDSVQSIGWHLDPKGWWYASGTKDGEYFRDTIVKIGGSLHVFNDKGYLHNGFFRGRYEGELITGYCGDRGVMITSPSGNIEYGMPINPENMLIVG